MVQMNVGGAALWQLHMNVHYPYIQCEILPKQDIL